MTHSHPHPADGGLPVDSAIPTVDVPIGYISEVDVRKRVIEAKKYILNQARVFLQLHKLRPDAKSTDLNWCDIDQVLNHMIDEVIEGRL